MLARDTTGEGVHVSDLRPSRRRVLAGALRTCAGAAGGSAALPWLSGCSDDPEKPDPLQVLLRQAENRERELLARYAATMRRHPSLAPQLAVPRTNHEEHLRALVGRRRARTGSGEPGAQAGGRKGDNPEVSVPESAQEALAALVRAERRAADEAVGALAEAPARLRRLLASLGGSEASHAALLASGGSA
jgi:hypothetical protein